jgi:hypothetical protein
MTENAAEQLDEMGTIDWVILEWLGTRPEGGEVAPMIVDLVDRGIIRILDIGFVAKDAAGNVTALDFDHLEPGSAFEVFAGASSGLLDHEDLADAAEALSPESCAAIIIWENRWSAPLAVALRRSGGQLIGSGRLPLQALLAALDAAEAVN